MTLNIDVEEAAGKFAQEKIEALFVGKGYTETDLSVLRLALEVGYLAGHRDARREHVKTIDSILENLGRRIQ